MARAQQDRWFERYRETGAPALLAKVFDRTAPELLRVAGYLTRGDVDRVLGTFTLGPGGNDRGLCQRDVIHQTRQTLGLFECGALQRGAGEPEAGGLEPRLERFAESLTGEAGTDPALSGGHVVFGGSLSPEARARLTEMGLSFGTAAMAPGTGGGEGETAE